MSNETDTTDEQNNVVQMFEDIEFAEHPDGSPLFEHVYTNDPRNPMLPRLFHFLHDAMYKNKVGIMHAYNSKSKQVHTLIVGVEVRDDQVYTMPIAKILTAEEQENYHAPDGQGNWLGLDE